MKPITICFIYFRTLTLVNLEAALFCVRQQDFSQVEEIVFVDNNSEDAEEDIRAVIDDLKFPVPVVFFSYKHEDPTKTHSWSTNAAVRAARTPWVFMTRADYLTTFDILARFAAIMQGEPDDWNGFVTSDALHVDDDMPTINQQMPPWRNGNGPSATFLTGVFYDYTCIDTGVWLGRRDAWERVGGVDERFTVWGHSQTHYQWKLHKDGVQCRRIPEVLFFHPAHGEAKDVELAHRQAAELGLSLPEMWARFERKQY